MSYRKVIYFFDETSINLWCTNKRTWTGTENPITLPMQPKRDRSQTIMAAMGGDPMEIIHHVCGRTNSEHVMEFLRIFIDR